MPHTKDRAKIKVLNNALLKNASDDIIDVSVLWKMHNKRQFSKLERKSNMGIFTIPFWAMEILLQMGDGIFKVRDEPHIPFLGTVGDAEENPFKKTTRKLKDGIKQITVKGLQKRLHFTLYVNEEGQFHRNVDRPALTVNGNRAWFKNGVLHRDGDNPAFIKTFNKSFYYYKDGKIHRDGLKPAIVKGKERFIYKNGKFCLKYIISEPNKAFKYRSIVTKTKNKCIDKENCLCKKEFGDLSKDEFRETLIEIDGAT